MTTQVKRAKAIIEITCRHFGITKEEFFAGRNYKCSDARKVAIAVLLETGVCGSITEAAKTLNIERSTASIALKTLKGYLSYNEALRAKHEAILKEGKRKRATPERSSPHADSLVSN